MQKSELARALRPTRGEAGLDASNKISSGQEFRKTDAEPNLSVVLETIST